MGMDQRLMRPKRRRGNAAPSITVPGAQTVEWNVTGVTPKNSLALTGISVADSDDDDVTVTLAATHGVLTVPFALYDNTGINTREMRIRVPTDHGAFTVTYDGATINLNSTTDDTAALNAAIFTAYSRAGEGGNAVATSGSDTTYLIYFSSSSYNSSIYTATSSLYGGPFTYNNESADDGHEDIDFSVTGDPASLNLLLAGLIYTPDDDYAGSDTLTIDAEDENGADAVQKTVAISVEFDPLDLAPLVLLTDTFSDNGTTPSVADGPVQDWVNAGSLGGSYRQTDEGSRPTHRVVNGVKVVRGAGAHLLEAVGMDFSGVTGCTMALLAKKTVSNDEGAYGRFGTDGNTHSNYSDGDLYDSLGSTTRRQFTGPDWTSWTRYIVTSKSGEWTARLNGSQVFTTGTNTVAFLATTMLFASTGTGQFFDGDIAFFGIFPELASNEILQIEAYLALIKADLEA